MQARTTIELLRERSEELRGLLALVLERSGLERMQMSGPDLVIVGPDHRWTPLELEGRRLQSRLLAEYERFSSLIQTLLRQAPARTLSDADAADKTIRAVIDQSGATFYTAVDQAQTKASGGIDQLVAAVESLHDPSEGDTIYVPDANAVMWNPDLDEWVFEGTDRFTLLLTSTLLGELDDLKMPHRPQSVRNKAEGLINRIKEYGRRGDPHMGVTLRKERSVVRTVAIEPDFSQTPPVARRKHPR